MLNDMYNTIIINCDHIVDNVDHIVDHNHQEKKKDLHHKRGRATFLPWIDDEDN